MKRGRSVLHSKCPIFPYHEKPGKRHKPSFALSPPTDWGNLPYCIVLQIFQHLSLVDRARSSSVCRCWNDVFHMPDLWRRFEFELNQPAKSYLRSTHPDLIQQIIKKHAQHLQYVSFKVRAFHPLPVHNDPRSAALETLCAFSIPNQMHCHIDLAFFFLLYRYTFLYIYCF